MTILFDTNFLLSTLTDRDQAQRQIAEALFRGAVAGHCSVAVPQFILFETCFVLTRLYSMREDEVSSMVADLRRLEGVAILDELPLDLWLELWPAKIRGPVDAALAALSVQKQWPIATFDRAFARRVISLGGTVWSEP